MRSNVGGALLPWIYTAVVLVIHIPVVVIRVVRWETVQNWCLLATLGTVAIQIQAYVSTQFQAEQILTWTPLLLIIDASSMAQLVFLLVDDFHLWRRTLEAFRFLRRERFRPVLDIGPWSRLHRSRGSATYQMNEVEQGLNAEVNQQGWIGPTSNPIERPLAENEFYAPDRRNLQPSVHTNSSHTSQHKSQELPEELLVFKDKAFYTAIIAFLMFITVIILQILGIAKARAALKGGIPDVQWCSPIFQPFGIAVLDGNCNVFPVEQTFNKGLGCIKIPGAQQMQWLRATSIGTGLSIGLEFIDVIILALVHGSARHRGVKMRRPWCTMIAGLVALGLFLVFGVVYSSTLPAGISQKVWLIIDTGEPSIWSASLSTTGLRGALIGWNDGVFSGWRRTYFGGWLW